MSRSVIYTVDAQGALTAMRPSAPRSEDFMQALVGRHPGIIADEDGALLLIRREQPIADREDGAGRWSLDHLFVTRGGVPVLVELKRATDTRLRREVVGQMLDYAANGTAYWQAGRIAESFAATVQAHGGDVDGELSAFLGGADPEEFWRQVDSNFSAGRIKMVFVADTIPPELARIVEFLNEQMKADVRAVELSWFEGDGGVTALTPRIIGETQRAQAEKAGRRSALPPIERGAWIEEHLARHGGATVGAADAYVRLVEEAGGQAEVTSAQASVVSMFELPSGRLYPMTLSRNGKGSVQLCLGYLASRPAFAPDEVRQALYDRLVAIVGPLSTKTLNGFPGFPVTKLNDPAVQREVLGFLVEVVEMARAGE